MSYVDFNNLPAYHSSEEILAHPRFPRARDKFVTAILALYEHKPFLNRLLLEASRTVLVCNIMVLHARYDEADRATWPTLRLVTETMAFQQLASPSRVQDLVSRLIKTRYLEARPAPADRRVRILTPTKKMIEQDHDFLVSHYLPLSILYPKPGYPLIMKRNGAFQIKQRQVSGELFALGAKILHGNPIMMLFQGRDAGVMVLIKMIQMAAQQGGGPLEVSYADLGGRFGVSRTHVRKLLAEAEKLDLVRLSKEDGKQFIELLPSVLQAFDRLIAESQSGLDLCYQLALRLK